MAHSTAPADDCSRCGRQRPAAVDHDRRGCLHWRRRTEAYERTALYRHRFRHRLGAGGGGARRHRGAGGARVGRLSALERGPLLRRGGEPVPPAPARLPRKPGARLPGGVRATERRPARQHHRHRRRHHGVDRCARWTRPAPRWHLASGSPTTRTPCSCCGRITPPCASRRRSTPWRAPGAASTTPASPAAPIHRSGSGPRRCTCCAPTPRWRPPPARGPSTATGSPAC